MNKRFIYSTFIFQLLMLFTIRFLMGFDGLYGQDSYEYLRYSASLREFILTGSSPGDYFWPVCYPLVGTILSLLIPDTGFCLQLISVISSYLVFLYTLKIIQLIYPKETKRSFIYLCILLCLSPFFLRFSILIMADMFTLAVIIAGTYYVLKFTRNKSIQFLCLGTFLLMFGFMTRYAAIVIIAPVALYALFHFIKQKISIFFIPLVLISAILPFIPHILLRTENSVQFLQHAWLTNWSPYHFFQSNFKTQDGSQQNIFPNLIYTLGGLFHPRYFFIGILITFIGFKKIRLSGELKILITCILLYLVFLAGIPYQNNRFLLLALPFLLIIYYQPAIYVAGIFGKKIEMVLVIGIIMVQLGLFTISLKKIWDRTMLEKSIYQYVIKNKVQAIYTMDVDISIMGRGYTLPIYNIWSNYYEPIDTQAIVIYNTSIFSKQWKGMNPEKNWEHFNKEYSLKEVKTFNEGWKAYVFE